MAKIYVDGALKTTGTTWEDYYRNDKEAAGNDNQILPIDWLLFRAGGIAVPATAGKGFLIDNLTLASGSSTAPAATVVTTSEHATSCTEYSVREVTTSGQLVAGGLAGLVALLVMGAGLALRRRHGAV